MARRIKFAFPVALARLARRKRQILPSKSQPSTRAHSHTPADDEGDFALLELLHGCMHGQWKKRIETLH